MTKDEELAFDLALEALEGVVKNCWRDIPSWRLDEIKEQITVIKQARALDKMAENARELGLDYEPVDGTQVSKVWWDGEKLMAKPIPLEDFYLPTPVQPVQEPVAWAMYQQDRLQSFWLDKGDAYDFEFTPEHRWEPLYTTPPAAQPAPVQPVGTYGEIHESMQALLRSGLQRDQQIYMAMKDRPLYTTPPAQPAPVQEPVAFEVGLVEWVGNKLMATPKVTTTPPASWVEMVVANLVREGVNKHKARELAEHFYWFAQRPFVGLTDEEISDIAINNPPMVHEFARAIEAKLKEKNSDR